MIVLDGLSWEDLRDLRNQAGITFQNPETSPWIALVLEKFKHWHLGVGLGDNG